jgi:hypothetical protein
MTALRLFPLLALFACGTPKDDSGIDDTTATDGDADTDSDTDAACSGTACGGDPTGNWTITDVCVDDSEEPLDCPGSYMRIDDITMEGTVDLNADMTYASQFTRFDMTYVLHMPSTCIGGMSCSDFSAAMGDGYSCVEAGDGCDCTGMQSAPSDPDSGTWAVDGTNLELSSSNGSGPPDAMPFCAEGDTLWVSVPASESGDLGFSMLLTK